MPETLDRRSKLIRVIEDPFSNDPDYFAENELPEDSEGFLTYKIGRSSKSVKFTRRFFDAGGEVVTGGTFDAYCFSAAPSGDNDGFLVIHKATPLVGFSDISPIEDVQETDRFGIRVSNVVPPGGATVLKIWICGNEYDEDEG